MENGVKQQTDVQAVLWEENVPLMQQGLHRELVKRAYEGAGESRVYPLRENVFTALRLTSLAATKVVIIGQDPYFNEHPGKGPEAHGICFSVQQGIPVPPSLRNILQEVNSSVYNGEKVSVDSDLTRWARQGVLLLNASLTVMARRPNSHVQLGWHALTDDIIATVSNKKEHVVFMLWGAFAQKKKVLIDSRKHLILATSHPSPLSAHRGFLGSNVFVKCNAYLRQHHLQPIAW
ncbi:uracil-DNA glycosylase [Desulfopila sp. IMCC35006]|uniref:uracil-DNA glycosylase n=1 Tax=Desulfopila sp. IMCC35006 TaxID=2569542 RepID=UPI0010AB777B|nr:uracil-DNA glycosylase [Desulfopila sp. IMCC35006]